MQTRGMITVDQETWMTLLGCSSFAIVLLGYLATMKRDVLAAVGGVESRLDAKIDTTRADLGALDNKIYGLRTELKADNHDLRTELKADLGALDNKVDGLRTELKRDIRASYTDLKTELGKVGDRLTAIESRTYDISTRLPPAPAGIPGQTP